MNVARFCLFAAWGVAVIGAAGSLENAPARHRAIAAAVTAIPLGIVLVAVERWITKHGGRPKLTGEIICLEADPRFDMKDDDYEARS
jgi:hypothetical protein